MKINTIFNYWQFWKIKKSELNWKFGKIHFWKIENRKNWFGRQVYRQLGTRKRPYLSVYISSFQFSIAFFDWRLIFTPIFNSKLSNSLIRLWILKHKSIVEIQISIFNFQFLEAEVLFIVVFSKKFEIQVTIGNWIDVINQSINITCFLFSLFWCWDWLSICWYYVMSIC